MRNMSTVMVCWLLLMSAQIVAEDDPMIGDKPLSELVKQLRSENRGFQVRAARALSEAPTNTHAAIVPQVMFLLKSERENDKFVAAQILGVCGPLAKSAVPDLLPMLGGTQYERNRAAAAKALGQILKDSQPSDEIEKVTQALVKGFSDQYPDVRRESVYACGMIGPAAKSCIKSLKEPLEFCIPNSDGDGPYALIRQAAAWTITRMGPLAREYVDLLISLMHREWTSSYVRALGAIGPVQDNIIPNIIDKMESSGRGGDAAGLKSAALEVLAGFGEKSAAVVPLIRRTLQGQMYGDDPMTVRIAMMKALPAFGAAAKEAAPEILAQLRVGQESNDSVHLTLKAEAQKAYKALMGEDPPSGVKK
jgi:hypothetical protein